MRAASVVLLLLVLLALSRAVSADVTVTLTRLSHNPIITLDDSDFKYNYNAAFFYDLHGVPSLLIRAQNATHIYDVGPSYLVFTRQSPSNATFDFVSQKNVMLGPDNDQPAGAEDPRVLYNPRDQTYYCFFTSVQVDAASGGLAAHLALATATDPSVSWTMRGLVFPQVSWSKSGALLLRDSGPHMLFWGDDSIRLASTNDILHFSDIGDILISPRSDFFDSALVESGPPPMVLRNGDILFLYNSARKANIPNPKNYDLQYNLGYLILDGKDPSVIKQRSSTPILSPVLDWERCDNDSLYVGLTPNVVFVEGWIRPDPHKDEFLVVYQGCDSFLGMAKIVVT